MDGKTVFDSREVSDLWGKGRIQIDAFSPAAAQYVTNYVRKKVAGRGAAAHYGVRVPEFQVMSRRPGIGGLFIRKFMRDVYPDGFVTRAGGSKRRAPRFYDLTLEKSDAKMFRKVKRRRKEMAILDVDKKGSRLYTLHEVAVERNKFFDSIKGRPYEVKVSAGVLARP
ncbi:MAG: replication initiator protein [Microviridae sp.]|nr:MAG: replication initiator protein [Microviridae sp.]